MSNSLRHKTLGFRKSHAFVIGINEYRGLNANLKTAVKDAQDIAMRLKVLQGFDHVLLMNNVGLEQIRQLLDWLAPKEGEERSNKLTIPNQVFTYGDQHFSSQIGWLKTVSEVGPKFDAALPSLSFNWERKGEKEVTELVLVSEADIDIEEGDSLVFYYAGHGFPGEVKAGPAGYLSPTDTKFEFEAVTNASLLPMDELYEAFSQVSCKHTLLLLDCCFAGKFRFSSLSRAGRKPFIQPLYKRRFERYKSGAAWQVLVSSGPEQTANDSAKWANIRENSPFAAVLKEALEGKADLHTYGNKTQGDGIITATELFLYIWNKVEKITSKKKVQHPGLFPMAQHREGEFIFLNPTISSDAFKFAKDPDRNPYKGLLPYEPEDANLFFGREKALLSLLRMIKTQQENSKPPVIFLTAPSAAGKSSMVRAGLFPSLQKKYGYEELLIFRPASLDQITGQSIIPDEKEFKGEYQRLDWTGFAGLKSRLDSTKNQMVLLDQFEEFFTELESKETQHAFEAALLSLLEKEQANREHPLMVIITLRSDVEWQMPFTKLGGEGGIGQTDYWRSDHIFRLQPMDLDELREALTGPAWWALHDFKNSLDGDFKDDGEELINQILKDVMYYPAALPMLSCVMQLFYEKAKAEYRNLKLAKEDYDQLGGVEGALSARADKFYEAQDEERQQLLQKIFLRMVNPSDGGRSRRKVTYSESQYSELPEELAQLGAFELDYGRDGGQLKQLIDEMEAQFLLVQSQDTNGQPTVEPAHDALITYWPICRQWIQDFGHEQLLLQRKLWNAVVDSESKFIPDAYSTNASSFWDTNLSLNQLIASLLEAAEPLLFQAELHALQEVRQQIEAGLDGVDQLLFRQLLQEWRVSEKPPGFDDFIDTNASNELLNALLEHVKHWLNQKEIAFVQHSWSKRSQRVLNLKQEREAAVRQKVLTEATKRQVLANGFAFKSQINPDRTTAFRLAEYALAIDPDNPIAQEQLIKWTSFSKEPLYATLIGHSDAVWSAVFSKDGSRILSASKEIMLWDVQTGKVLRQFPGQERACFSFDEKQIAFATGDFKIVVWDLEQDHELYRFPAHNKNIFSLQYSPDGRPRLLSAARDGTVKIWDLEKKKLALELIHEDHIAEHKPATYSPNGQRVVAMAQQERSGTIILWNALSGDILGYAAKVAAHHGAATFLSNNEVLSASADNKLRLWPLPINDFKTLLHHSGEGYFGALAVSADDKLIAIAYSTDVRVYELKTRKELFLFRIHSGACRGMAFSPDGKHLATYADDRTIRIWHLASEKRHFIQVKNVHHNPSYYLKSFYSADGARILCISKETGARLWDIHQQKELSTFASGTALQDGAFSANGKRIVLAATDGAVRIWDTDNPQTPSLSLLKHEEEASFARFFRKDMLLLSAYKDGTIKVWDAESGQERATLFGHTDRINYLDVSADGTEIITVSSDETLKIWNLPATLNGQAINAHKSIRPGLWTPRSVTYSSDHTKFVVGGFSGLKVYDTKSLSLLHHFRHARGRRVYNAGFSPDDSKVVSMSDNGTVKVWNLLTGRLWFTLAGFSHTLKWIDLHPKRWEIAITIDDQVQIQSLDSTHIISSFTENQPLSVLTEAEMKTYDFDPGLAYAGPGWWTNK